MVNSVLYEEQDKIAIISINRPERLNTLTAEVIGAVGEYVDQAASAEEVAAIILRAAGPTVSAGKDQDHNIATKHTTHTYKTN